MRALHARTQRATVMRNHPDFIPELAFVLEREGTIIGNIMYTKAWLEDETGKKKEIVSFGPLCVAPEYQRQKLGKVLIEHSFDIARKLGYDVNINFGNPVIMSVVVLSAVKRKTSVAFKRETSLRHCLYAN